MLNIIVNGPAKAAGLIPGELINIDDRLKNKRLRLSKGQKSRLFLFFLKAFANHCFH